MNFLLHLHKTVLLLLWTSLITVKVSCVQHESPYFFYQQPAYPRDCKEARDHCSSDKLSGIYTIKPVGYLKPFEAYCDNNVSFGGWTVIQRQIDGSLTFKRSWKDYQDGFGFLSSEFWIGHDKLSYLTNQAVYELRVDIIMSNGSSFYVNYKSFRISDEWNSYAIVSAGDFVSNWSCIASLCPLNMTADSCSCQTLCNDPIEQTDCYTECAETCVPKGCFVAETDSFIKNGEIFINEDCSRNCTCIDYQLNCDVYYQCSPDATCMMKDQVRKCYCNEGYGGDGETCIRVFKDCYEAYQTGNTTDGIYNILPTDWPGSPIEVFCNMTFGDGGWTVFQRRTDGLTDFYRNWTEYKDGFGLLNEGNDFWLGNKQLHYITDQKDYILRIDLVGYSNRLYYQEFTTFKIGDESTKYRLSYTSLKSGNTGYNYTLSKNNGTQFSTHDQDNDGCNNHHFAQRHRGGWWYSDNWCNGCFRSSCRYFEYGSSGCYALGSFTNLNGDYKGGKGANIFYSTTSQDCNYKFTEVKIRPSN